MKIKNIKYYLTSLLLALNISLVGCGSEKEVEIVDAEVTDISSEGKIELPQFDRIISDILGEDKEALLNFDNPFSLEKEAESTEELIDFDKILQHSLEVEEENKPIEEKVDEVATKEVETMEETKEKSSSAEELKQLKTVREIYIIGNSKDNGYEIQYTTEDEANSLNYLVKEGIDETHEFLNTLKQELFEDEVHVFTPKGDIKVLPRESTPIDLAYNIHEQVGNKMIGAKVNGKLVSIDCVIQNGDRIEILTSQNTKGPSRDWLNIVKSTQAKNKINQWFRSEFKEENISKGKELISQYCKAKNIDWPSLNQLSYQSRIMSKYGFRDWESVLAAVGHGGLKEGQIVNKMMEYYQEEHRLALTDEDILKNMGQEVSSSSSKEKRISMRTKSGIVVKGIDDVAVRFSRCCAPVPGDEIVGFVTRGRGISIHRTDCINVLNLSDLDQMRLLDAEWQTNGGEDSRYMAEIKIFGNNRTGLLTDITQLLAERKIDIVSVNSNTSKQEIATITLAFRTKGKDELNSVVDKIRQVESVIEIERTRG